MNTTKSLETTASRPGTGAPSAHPHEALLAVGTVTEDINRNDIVQATMSIPIKRLFVNGFPSLYGGAGTELHHQILVWRKLGVEVHLIPSWDYHKEPLYNEMVNLGVIMHAPGDWSPIQPGDPVLGFCNAEFLNALPDIRKHTKRTVFVNCMTWLFPKEKEAVQKGEIAMLLYQNEPVRQNLMPILRQLNGNPELRFMTFKPYFHAAAFPFIPKRESDFFGCGRISRQDSDKFAANTLHIYDTFVAPVPKHGLFLGFDKRSEDKIGRPFDWIQIAHNQTEVSQQDFYKHCSIILQATDTTENWPRIGFEAMASGSVLIVDNRGGWQQMVQHGKTGWLCDNERDFIYYASKMAYEPNLRDEMAEAARLRGLELGGLEVSMESWQQIFEAMGTLPA